MTIHILSGMGSACDLFGLSFRRSIPDLSAGFQRDAEAIAGDFLAVGADIWKSIEEFQPTAEVEKK